MVSCLFLSVACYYVFVNVIVFFFFFSLSCFGVHIRRVLYIYWIIKLLNVLDSWILLGWFVPLCLFQCAAHSPSPTKKWHHSETFSRVVVRNLGMENCTVTEGQNKYCLQTATAPPLELLNYASQVKCSQLIALSVYNHTVNAKLCAAPSEQCHCHRNPQLQCTEENHVVLYSVLIYKIYTVQIQIIYTI